MEKFWVGKGKEQPGHGRMRWHWSFNVANVFGFYVVCERCRP
jgi:hypothetical protein